MNTVQSIDINCDLGEVSRLVDCHQDSLLMRYISSCNIACGGHAGNSEIIRKTIQNAKQQQLKIGAHPGYPDRQNFGRKSLQIKPQRLIQTLQQQLDEIIHIAAEENTLITHIKLHGALYNDVENNIELASLIANFFLERYPTNDILCLAGGELSKACNQLGLKTIAEGFMDRAYLSNGKLMPRNLAGAVFTDAQSCVEQAITLVKNTKIKIASLCLHGDNENAIEIAEKVYLAMKQAGIKIQ